MDGICYRFKEMEEDNFRNLGPAMASELVS